MTDYTPEQAAYIDGYIDRAAVDTSIPHDPVAVLTIGRLERERNGMRTERDGAVASWKSLREKMLAVHNELADARRDRDEARETRDELASELVAEQRNLGIMTDRVVEAEGEWCKSLREGAGLYTQVAALKRELACGVAPKEGGDTPINWPRVVAKLREVFDE